MNFNSAEFVISFGISSQLPPANGLEIAFAGRSNVGKSSAINKIFNRKGLARVSAVPGKTATINFYKVEDVTFVDLPGYGYAKVAKSEKYRWSELIEGYFNQERDFGLVISLIDMRHPIMDIDLAMIEFLMQRELPFIVVMTKCDKLNKTQFNERVLKIKQEIPHSEEILIIPFSSETGQGVDEIKKIIEEVNDNYEEAVALDLEMQDAKDNANDKLEQE